MGVFTPTVKYNYPPLAAALRTRRAAGAPSLDLLRSVLLPTRNRAVAQCNNSGSKLARIRITGTVRDTDDFMVSNET